MMRINNNNIMTSFSLAWSLVWNLSIFPLIFALVFSRAFVFVAGKEVTLDHNELKFNQPHDDHLSGPGVMRLYSYDLDAQSDIMAQEIVVTVSVDSSQDFLNKPPLLVTLAYQDTISVMKLPNVPYPQPESKISSNQTKPTQLVASRTLCLEDPGTFKSNSTQKLGLLRITIHTENPQEVHFNLQTSLSNRPEIELGQPFAVQNLAWNSPQIFLFPNPPTADVLVRVDSLDDICMTFSLQQPQCPVRDAEDNVGFKGWWQTVTKQGALTISPSTHSEFQQGFHIVLVVHRDNELCRNSSSASVRYDNFRSVERGAKAVSITITSKDEQVIILPFPFLHMLVPVLIFLFISLTAFLITQSHQYEKALKGTFPSKCDLETSEQLHQNFIHNQRQDQKAIFLPDFNEYNVQEGKRRRGSYFTTVFVSALFYTIPVYQLIIHNLVTLHKTGEFDLCYYNYLCAHPAGWVFDFNHVWSNIGYVIFGIAFILIVRVKKFKAWKMDVDRLLRVCKNDENVQETVLDGSTDADVELQALPQSPLRRFFKLPDGEKIPVFKGRLQKPTFYKFIHREDNQRILTMWREIRHHGLSPHNYGLDQAIGFALVMEGFLSADTNFMYTICILGLLKVYQFRHPIHPNSNNVFRLLAAFCLVCVVGLAADYSENQSFRLSFKILFSISHFVVTVYISVYKYGLGYVKERNCQDQAHLQPQVTDVIQTQWHPKFRSVPPFAPFDGDWEQIGGVFKDFCEPYMRGRSLVLIFSILGNAGLILLYFVTPKLNFADYFLFVLMGNFILSTAVYISRKIFLERRYKVGKGTLYNNSGFLRWQPVVYLILCLGFGALAVSCFLSKNTNWADGAAISRNGNKVCDESVIVIDTYYDSHDYWHFLSAVMLFSGFMMLLTLDDNLFGLRRSLIFVF